MFFSVWIYDFCMKRMLENITSSPQAIEKKIKLTPKIYIKPIRLINSLKFV